MLKRLFPLLLLLFFSAVSAAQDATSVVIDTSPLDIPLGPLPTAIVSDGNSAPFSLDRYRPSLLPSTNSYLYRLDLTNQLPASRLRQLHLMMLSNIVQHLEVGLFRNGNLVRSQALGVTNPGTASSLQLPTFTFEVSGGNDYYLLLRKQTPGPGAIPLVLADDQAMERHVKFRYFTLGMLISALLLLAAYTTALGSINRDRRAIMYIAYFLYVLLAVSVMTGLTRGTVPFGVHLALVTRIPQINMVGVVMIQLICWVYLDCQHRLPQVKKPFASSLAINTLVMASTFFLSERAAFYPFVFSFLLSTVTIVWVCLEGIKHNSRPAKLFLACWVIICIGSFINTSAYMGLIEAGGFTLNAYGLSMVLVLSILSIGIGDVSLYRSLRSTIRAYRDGSTGVPTFDYLVDLYKEDLGDHLRRRNVDCWLVLLRIGELDRIASIFGMSVSKEAYRQLMRRARDALSLHPACIRLPITPSEYATMVGFPGGEVAILAQGNLKADFLTKLQNTLESPLSIAGIETHVSIQAGIARLYDPSTKVLFDLEDAHRLADTALIDGTKAGNKIAFASSSTPAVHGSSAALARRLYQAIEAEELALHIQPQYGFEGQLLGGEVLVRWFSPDLGFVSPDVFIPLAEDANIISQITRQVIKRSFDWLVRYDDALPPGFALSINLSVKDFNEPGLFDDIHSYSDSLPLKRGQVTFEITETASTDKLALFVKNINKIKTLGFKVALDDFGTGHSTLSYMQAMAPDVVKIDMAFIRDIDQSAVNQNIVEAICRLATAVKATTVAEGVETDAELQTLKALGVSYVQGYLLGKPVPAKDFVGTYL
ncbi:EAL domain-containing protein [Gallaecimonas kandeliae]|uniref:EAL domain-containing protein n=1 Tax=Gallaecimonas kandeliae TaxID=3029055 RepID=UPI00264726E1|nr:EAL domain-containing protein [Gallaecimonas kandeliae]WKE64253.1 EAL domain-containing protein [Gallaecimonas kandeliae]